MNWKVTVTATATVAVMTAVTIGVKWWNGGLDPKVHDGSVWVVESGDRRGSRD